MLHNKHYIMIDDKSRIISGWSDGPHRERDTTNAICINERGGYQFRLSPDGVENPILYSLDGTPKYRWDGKQALPIVEEVSNETVR